MNNYKLIGISLAVLLTLTIIIVGFTTNSAYAHSSKVKVGCKDLALDLITWDQLYYAADGEEVAASEDDLADDDIEPSLYRDIIDEHMEELLDDFEDAKCKHLDKDIKEFVDDHVDFERPD